MPSLNLQPSCVYVKASKTTYPDNITLPEPASQNNKEWTMNWPMNETDFDSKTDINVLETTLLIVQLQYACLTLHKIFIHQLP